MNGPEGQIRLSRGQPQISRQLTNQRLIQAYRKLLGSEYKPQFDILFQGLNQEITEPVNTQIMEFIYENNLMRHILNSKEFTDILDQEKKLRGEDTKVGTVICIDGRIYILYQFGRAINVKEIAGSLVELNSDKSKIKDIDFITVLDAAASEGRELLEIVTAHTGDHGCGRIALGIQKKEFSGNPDTVAIEEAEKRAALIEEKYNQILKQKGKKPQKKVAIPAMINTDDMGLTLGFGKEHYLSTTNFTRQLKDKINHNFPHNQFGSMKDSFGKPEHFIEYSKKVLDITKYLMETETGEPKSQIVNVKKYIKGNYPGLTDKQQKALLFTFCRTVANQYVMGMTSKEQAEKSPSAHHNEQFMVVSTGKPFARFEIQEQAFASATSDKKEMLSQVKIELGLLDEHNKTKPYILFVSTSVQPNNIGTVDYSRSKEYFQALYADREVKQRIDDGTIVIVPILVNEKNGEVLQIQDYSIYS